MKHWLPIGFWILIVLGPALEQAYAQEDEYYDSLLTKTVIVETPVYKPVIGAGAGVVNFFGDVRNNNYFPLLGNNAFKINASTYLDRKRLFRANFNLLMGTITANQRSFTNLEKNLNFKSTITNFGINLEYTFSNFFDLDKRSFRPFISVGLENISFNTKGDRTNSQGLEYHYWSDGTIRNISETQGRTQPSRILNRDYNYETDLRELDLYGLGNYSRNAFSIPVDVGFDFSFTQRTSLRLASSLHYTLTDYIDNVSSEVDGLGNGQNDWYTFSYVMIQLDLFSEPKVQTEELVFAELEDFDYSLFEDEDGDGVLDMEDECLGTPKFVAVDTLGCPIDSDQDGVPDYKDVELDTPPGTFVDDQGRAISPEELAELLSFRDAVSRSEVEKYLNREGFYSEYSQVRITEIPPKFRSVDRDGDGYISFDELLDTIDRYFDFETDLSSGDIYELNDFFFRQ